MQFIKKLALGYIVTKDLIASEGLLKFISKSVNRFFKYLYFKLFKSSEFEFNNHSYNYFYSLFNATFTNERAVEIPIVLDIVKTFLGKKVLELGNVLHWYFEFKHDVVDKSEKGQGVINEDIVEYRTCKKYDLIISISTLEHVGWDEVPTEKNKALRAVENIKNLLAENGVMLITFPFGYNQDLDLLIEEGRLKFTEINFLKRISKDNRWKQVKFDEIKKGSKYGFPYPSANAIVIAKAVK